MKLEDMFWLHKKSGNKYFIRGYCIREADLALLVRYSRVGTALEWVRPASEWFDGRFEIVVP
jgi:hypothetical protein